MKLDLGSGPHPKEGFLGVDIIRCTDFTCDLTFENWQWKSNSIEELRSSHFIEHIPASRSFRNEKDCFFHFFDEAFRVLRPGGLFTVIWPALHSVAAFMDPTHRRYIPPETLQYLSKAGREQLRVTQYNADCDWQIESITLSKQAEDRTRWHIDCAEFTALLRKPL